MHKWQNKEASPDSIGASFLLGFAKAFNAHDVNAILSYMADDRVFLASAGADANGEEFAGKDAVKKAFEEVFKTLPGCALGKRILLCCGKSYCYRMVVYGHQSRWQQGGSYGL